MYFISELSFSQPIKTGLFFLIRDHDFRFFPFRTGSMKTGLFLQAKLYEKLDSFFNLRSLTLDPLLKEAKVSLGVLGASLRVIPLSRSGDGEYDFLGFQPSFVLLKSAIDHQKLGSARNVNGKCALAATFVGFQKLMAIGLKNGLIYTGNPVGVIREKFRPHQIHVYTQQECFKKSTVCSFMRQQQYFADFQ
ncbi:hypothetical protein OIU76_008886 [Salix suchowensis]|nr:hypothetical protein OIU76_008886 [Salix suchowensis]